MGPRVLLAGILHESNGFVAGATPLAEFRVRRGDELLAARSEGSAIDGMLAGAALAGWTVVAAGDVGAVPSAPAEPAVPATFLDLVRASVVSADGPIAGVLLAMHGAMLAVGEDDVEGAVVRAIRTLPGLAEVPIVAAFDLHGNPSSAMCDALDAAIVYRRNPHDDVRETGIRAAAVLDRLIRDGRRGRCVVVHAGVLWPPIGTGTADEPMQSLEAAARAVERADPEVLEAAVFAGFPYADHAAVGAAVCVSTLGDPRVAADHARALAALSRRDRRLGDRRNLAPAAAVAAILAAPPGPVIVAEPSDNIGAGTRGDATGLLRLLLAHDLGGPCLAAICDPAAVAAMAGSPIGARRRLAIGGRGFAGDAGPVEREWTLRSRTDGSFRLEEPASPLAALSAATGQVVAMGPTIVLEDGAVSVVVTSVPIPPWDLGLWRSQGLVPERARVIAVKSAIAHRLAHDPIAVASVAVETPGPCPTDLGPVPYRRLRRPIHPLDALG